jgi:hypothetical protein
MAVSALNAAIPSGPLLEADGTLSSAWRGFFMALYARTGGAYGTTVVGVQNNVDAEAATRAAEDAVLSGDIASEATVRAAGDASEASARAAGDASLNAAKMNRAGDIMSGPLSIGLVGFQGAGPISRPTVSGACAGNTAIKALLTALASYGLINDSTSP